MDCSVLRLFDFDLLVDFDRFRRCLLRPKGPREFTLPESDSDSELELDEYIATVPAAAEETPTMDVRTNQSETASIQIAAAPTLRFQ